MMLSRVADALYWLGRYVERAEQVARSLDLTGMTLLDFGDLAPDMQAAQWATISQVFQLPPHAGTSGADLYDYLTFDDSHHDSLVSIISAARENARSVREVISTEMWRHLNTVYWSLLQESGRPNAERWRGSQSELYWHTYSATQLFFGMADDTIAHNPSHALITIGRFMERADKTVRFLDAQVRLLSEQGWQDLPTPLLNLQWIGLLKRCWCYEAYRKQHAAAIDPREVVGFVLLTRDMPRSVRYCIDRVYAGLETIDQAVDEHLASRRGGDGLKAAKGEGLLRRVGRLSSTLEYADVHELFEAGIHAFFANVEAQVQDICGELQGAYFLV